MRRSFLVMLALVAGAPLSAAGSTASDYFAGLRFSDGVQRSASSFGESAVYFVRFCGHCPGAAATMRTEIKKVHDLIEKERMPVHLVCTTPDKSPNELASYQKTLGMTGALFAQDTANPDGIGLNNIFQSYGLLHGRQVAYLSGGTAESALTGLLAGPAKSASHRFPVDGLTTDKGKELWWYVERGKPQAVPTLVTAAKGSPIKADAERILAVVQAAFAKRQEAAVAAPVCIEAVDALEALLTDGQGLDLKPAQDRLKALLAAPELKDELQARSIYRRIETLVAEARSTKAKDEAKANFKTLAEKFPATVYGKRAAQVR